MTKKDNPIKFEDYQKEDIYDYLTYTIVALFIAFSIFMIMI